MSRRHRSQDQPGQGLGRQRADPAFGGRSRRGVTTTSGCCGIGMIRTFAIPDTIPATARPGG
jgi:hypothetical protein